MSVLHGLLNLPGKSNDAAKGLLELRVANEFREKGAALSFDLAMFLIQAAEEEWSLYLRSVVHTHTHTHTQSFLL